MLVRVTNGASSVFEVVLLILLSHDVKSAAEKEAARLTLGLEQFELPKCKSESQVSMSTIIPFIAVFPFYI